MGQGGFNMPAQQAPAPVGEKQHYNVYTFLLVIAFVAMVIACVVLHQELMLFGETNWWNTGGIRPSIPAPVSALPSSTPIAFLG
ncbi:hypothetical protein Pla8534_34680 [Lignipirellula cremea]|uniref:Uncharacterized protein n=2 Tax=Lignipirellula cremea TaxID=2528010 RepID=A0A518DUY1_9BACT|nr:hypothetical protein Pla8534_34680 [Lignipirellula cremea]